MDFELISYFAVWYLGNIAYSETNGDAKSAFGNEFLMTIATAQLGVGLIFSLVQWMDKPAPAVGFGDLIKMTPAGICNAGAHAASVFSLGVGGKAFGQVVKAAEPCFAAIIGLVFYKKRDVSSAQWLCFFPIVFGIYLCSLKLDKGAELVFHKTMSVGDFITDFGKLKLEPVWASLIAASIANCFAAVKGQESHKFANDQQFQEKIGGKGNQFALMNALSFFFSMPLVYYKEYAQIGPFMDKFMGNAAAQASVVYSGLTFYIYNLAVLKSLKRISGVTSSVANTAKRVFVIGVAMYFGKRTKEDPVVILGCTICILGVFLYSSINDFLGIKKKKD